LHLPSPAAAEGVTCLQFFSRLPAPLQARAQSPEGLPLAEAPPDLVNRWLPTTLMAEAGAVTEEMQRELVFSLRLGTRSEEAPGGFELLICSARAGGEHPRTRRRQFIGPPPPRSALAAAAAPLPK
jgi:hypothetical protein